MARETSLCETVRDLLSQPGTWVRVHAGLTVTWAVLIIPSVLYWRDSVAWLVIMSAWANVAGSAASWQSAKADCRSVSPADIERIERDQKILIGAALTVQRKMRDLAETCSRIERGR